MFYANPSQVAGVGAGESGRFNARAALIPGGAADGMAQLAEALVRAPALRRQLEERQSEEGRRASTESFHQGLETRAADRADRAQRLAESLRAEVQAEKKSEGERRAKNDYMRGENEAVRLDETARHNRALEDALGKRAVAKTGAVGADGRPVRESQIEPYLDEFAKDPNDPFDKGHHQKRLKTPEEVQAEIGTRKGIREGLSAKAAPVAPADESMDAKANRVLALLDELQGKAPAPDLGTVASTDANEEGDPEALPVDDGDGADVEGAGDVDPAAAAPAPAPAAVVPAPAPGDPLAGIVSKLHPDDQAAYQRIMQSGDAKRIAAAQARVAKLAGGP